MKRSKTNILAIIILFISLVFLFSGISYSIFQYFGMGMTNNVIQTGKIVFSYSDAYGSENGISIENAMPIPDDTGKVLFGSEEYFDFTVSATTTSSNIAYEITVLKSAESTLDEKYVKVYLTTIEGTQEIETPITTQNATVLTYNQLNHTNNPLLTGKTVYYGTVQAGAVSYSRRFRLRMWVTDLGDSNLDYSQINDKYFSLKVAVAASSLY